MPNRHGGPRLSRMVCSLLFQYLVSAIPSVRKLAYTAIVRQSPNKDGQETLQYYIQKVLTWQHYALKQAP